MARNLLTTFKSHKTKDISWRKCQLKQLLKGYEALWGEMQTAITKDLQRSAFLSDAVELIPTFNEIKSCLNNVEKWSADEHVSSPFANFPACSKIKWEPLGVAGIISSWNYPIVTCIGPLATCIAAGNCAIIKPSEIGTHSEQIIKKLVTSYLDQSAYQILLGGPETGAELTSTDLDLIVFTGSTQIGKKVAQAAAGNLTPCILELGGKSPTIVDKSCNIDWASKKVLFSRFVNSGQTCIATDYVLVHKSIASQFKLALSKNLKAAFGNKSLGSLNPDLGGIINEMHMKRLCDMVSEQPESAKIIEG